MMFGLDENEIAAGDENAVQNPYVPTRDTPAGFFEGTQRALANTPEASASGLILAANRGWNQIGKLYGEDDWGNETRDDLVRIQKDLRPTPETTGMLGEVTYGLGKVLPQAVVGGLVGGPVGAGVVVGGVQGIEETEKLKSEGVDGDTAVKAGAVAGITQGLGVLIPASLGTGIATRIATGIGLNATMGGASRGVTGEILREHGYKDMAEQYRVLDGSALLTDVILGGAFGAAGGKHGKTDPRLPEHDPVNIHQPGDVDMGLAANSVRQYELDSAPGIPTDIETRNAHTQAMDIAAEQVLNGRPVDLGETLKETTFLTRPRDPSIADDFKSAAKENGISSILMENRARDEAVVQSVVEQSMRNAGRSSIEAESVAPLFARTLSRFSNAFGEPVTDAFNKSLLEFQQVDEAGRVVALGNNVTSLLNDVDAIRRGEQLDPSIHDAATDFGDRLNQLGITPEQARLMPAQQLLDQVYNVGKTAVEGAEALPTFEIGQNEDGQVTVGMRESPQTVNPAHQEAITNRLLQAPAVEEVSPLGFVSKMERVLGQKLNKNGTPEQFKEQLDAFQKAGQFKPDERNWSSLDSWLDEQPRDAKISRDDIIQHLQENRFKLVEHGEGEIGNGENVIDEIRLRDFHEDSRLEEPDDYYIRETARDQYEDDIRAEMEEENAALPEDEQLSPEALNKEIEQKAYDQALENYNDDPYNQTIEYSHDVDLPDGTSVPIYIQERNGGDYVEFKVGDREWKEARSVSDALQEAHLALSEDHGVSFDGDGGDGPQFEEYTGDGGSNYRFFRLATDELRGGEYKQTGHYPEKNVLVHMRTKDRVGPNGEKMLFIEELQSDLHQAAYKSKLKSGVAYKTDITPESIAENQTAYGLAEGDKAAALEKYTAAKDTITAEVANFLPGTSSNFKTTFRDHVVGNSTNIDVGRPAPYIAVDLISDRAFDLAHNEIFAEEAQPLMDMAAYQFVRKAANKIEENFVGVEGDSYANMVNRTMDGFTIAAEKAYGDGSYADIHKANIEEARKWMLEQPEPKIYSTDDLLAIREQIKNSDAARTLEEARKENSDASERSQTARAALGAGDNAPPGAPFSKTWREVGFKRLLARAADEGYESVGWTVGTQQNVRYNLSRFIDEMRAMKNEDGTYTLNGDQRTIGAIHDAAGINTGMSRGEPGNVSIHLTDEQLEAALGKEGAESIRNQAEGDRLTNIDFKDSIEVGGEKKGNLYDGMLPQEAGKILKKLDPSIKVEEVPYSIKENGRDIGKIWYAPLTDKAKADITQGFELFQQERGAITFNRAAARDFEARLKKVVIEFTNAADESTGIHEFTHWATATHRMYAELARKRLESGDTNPEVQRIHDDWETLKQEVGAKDDVFTREQEEKVASWFEGYARTGEAPSAKLQPIFDRFKDWLTKIYQDITGKGMEVSPAVKEIFDRWLADADEITSRNAKREANARDVNDTNVADSAGTQAQPDGSTVESTAQPGEGQATDPAIQQILAEKPDMMITDEDGNVVSAAEAIENAQAEVEQAQKDSALFDVAVSCFLRNSEV